MISIFTMCVLTVKYVQSYKHIPVWLMEAKRHIEPHQATFLMVGCKKDLARTEREVPKETAQVTTKSCERLSTISVTNSSYELNFLKIRAKYEYFLNKNTSKIRVKIRVKLKFLF